MSVAGNIFFNHVNKIIVKGYLVQVGMHMTGFCIL